MILVEATNSHNFAIINLHCLHMQELEWLFINCCALIP